VDLAMTNNAHDMKDADKDDAIVVAVTRDGSIFLNNVKVGKEDITGQVKDKLTGRLDKTVYVKSDARAKYGDVVAVVDEIRSAGVDRSVCSPKGPSPNAASASGGYHRRLNGSALVGFLHSFALVQGYAALAPTQRGLAKASSGMLAVG